MNTTPTQGERELPPLPQAVIDFDDFLNEPDSGENSASPVREFRHRAYRKWQAALSALQGRQAEPVAWRAWFDQDNGARWLFTLWPEEERLDVTWEPLYAAPSKEPT